MKKVKKNWLEWLVFALSAFLIAAVISFLIYESVTTGDAPPEIHVEIGEPAPRAGHFAIPITVTNKGDHTAEGVHVEVTLRAGAKEETGEFEVPFLPRRGSREAWVTFKADPRTGTLEAHVLGYQKP